MPGHFRPLGGIEGGEHCRHLRAVSGEKCGLVVAGGLRPLGAEDAAAPDRAEPSRRPLIVLTNDDGVKARGLSALRKELSTFADVFVIAPARNYSGSSQSLRIRGNIEVEVLEENSFYAVDAPPATCVHLAVKEFLAGRSVDLVVSGINHGQNVGRDVSTSGTVGAARMAAELGLPAVAFSLAYGSDALDAAAVYSTRIVKEFVRRKIKTPWILNINFPRGKPAAWKKPIVTRPGGSGFQLTYERGSGGKETLLFTTKLRLNREKPPEGSDAWAIRNGHISISALAGVASDAEVARLLGTWDVVR